MSRFGSFASVAGSETSLTSAWCSDTGSTQQQGGLNVPGTGGVGVGGELKIEEQQQQQGQSPEGFDPDLRRTSW